MDTRTKPRARWELVRDIVDFCEEHGGSMGGEHRIELEVLCYRLHEHGRDTVPSGECRCAECGAEFAVPAVARCPVCASNQVRRA